MAVITSITSMENITNNIEASLEDKFKELHSKLDAIRENNEENHEDIIHNFDELNKFTTQVNGVLGKYQSAIDTISLFLEFTIPIGNLRGRLSQQNLYLELILSNMEQDKHDMYLDTILSLPWYKKLFIKQRKKIKDIVEQKVEEIYQENIERIKNRINTTNEQLEMLLEREKEVKERLRKHKEEELKKKNNS